MKNTIEFKDEGTVMIYDYKKDGEVLSTVINYDDYLKIKDLKIKWCIVRNNQKGTLRVKSEVNGKKVYLHRLILDCPSNLVVDHIDRNPLNNRRENLRIVTQKQNTLNRNTKYSNYVYYDNRQKKFRVRLPIDGKKITICQYADLEEAITASKLFLKENL